MKVGGNTGDAIGGVMGHQDVGKVIGGGVGTTVGGVVGGAVGTTVGVVQGVRVGAEKGSDVDGIAHEVVKYMPSKKKEAEPNAKMGAIKQKMGMMEGRSFDNKNDDDNHDTKMAEPEVPPAPSPAPASTGKHESKSSLIPHNKNTLQNPPKTSQNIFFQK